MPEGARVTERKWIYDITQYTESTNANLDGWILIGSEWRQSGIGSIEYANFPSGFDKNHEYYKLYNNSPFTAFENESTKREVTNTLSEYIYWHWAYEPGLPGSSVNNRYILDHQGYDSSTGFTFKYFHAFKDKNDYEYYSNLGVYKHNAGKFWSWWWFRIDLMKSTYTDYTKYYKYTRTVKTESNTYPSGTGISNVQEWVKYELPEQTNVPAPVIDPSVPLEDEAPRIILDPDYVRTCAYNGNGYNYFKLRDIAYLLLGTPAQFSVEYDSYSRAIILTSGDEYIPVGDELMGKSAPDSSATITNNLIIINGKRYVLKAYMIGGYNYFMLRDIASMLDFDVDWDSATGNIIIEPEQPYTPD
ncbi:MAG: copper amine oxidase N-terminal domain-containing protein [Clostridiaceae bacterium]|nr:copper amine oxidase N-terminal domain-containing protein [Clostridiaceae bacterium]